MGRVKSFLQTDSGITCLARIPAASEILLEKLASDELPRISVIFDIMLHSMFAKQSSIILLQSILI